MEKKKLFTTKFIAGMGILLAVEIVLYIVGSIITIAPGTNLNLALVPIALGAILYGPIGGVILGLTNGVCTILTPAVQAYYYNADLFGPMCYLGTTLNCLTKCTLGGLVCGLVYLAFKNKNEIVGAFLGALCVPILNTGIFCIFAVIFYSTQLKDLLAIVFSFNFLIEFLSTAALCPAIIRILKINKTPNK